MKFDVWYRTDYFLNPLAARQVDAKSIKMQDYTMVLPSLEAECVDDAFRRMNVVDGSYIERVGNGPDKLPLRSMSVGDVLIDSDGLAHICKSIGWESFKAEFLE